jgi:hypothetical protein
VGDGISAAFVPIRGLDPNTSYEVVLTSSSSARSNFGFTTGSQPRMRLPFIQGIALELRTADIEGHEGGPCSIETPDRTVLQASVEVEFEAPVDAGFVIEVGFAQTATDAPSSFYPVDPANFHMTAHESFLALGDEPFNGTISLFDLDRWPGPEICATARVLRYRTTASNCIHPVDSCLDTAEQITTCAPKPRPPSGCTAAGTTADSWVLLLLVVLLVRVRHR